MYSPVTKSPKLGKYSPATTKSRARTRSGGASTSEYAPLEVQSAGYGGTDGGEVAAAAPSKMMIVAPVVISQFFERLAFYGLQVREADQAIMFAALASRCTPPLITRSAMASMLSRPPLTSRSILLQGNVALFLTRVVKLPSGDADAQLGLWFGVCYMTPLLGGYIADSYLGRWKAILLFFSVYLVGMVLVAFAAFMPSGPEASMIFFPAAYIVAAGMGGLKPLASTFGADQLDDDEVDEGDEEATGDAGEEVAGEGEGEGEGEGGLKDSYFSLLYWFQNLGAFAAFTVLVYLCQVTE